MPSPFDLINFLNVRSASAATFSPDGRFVAFLTNITGFNQLWQVPVSGGWPTQLTFAADAVHEAAYSPVRHEIVYEMDAGGDERFQLYLLTGTGPADHGLGDGWVSDNLTSPPKHKHGFGAWDREGKKVAFVANRIDPSRFDVYVQEKDQKVAHSVAKGPGGFFELSSSFRDGRFLLGLHEMSSANHDLYEVDAAGKNKPRLLTAHKGEARYEDPFYSHDGGHVWCRSTHGGRDRIGLARIELKTGKVEYVVEEKDEIDGALPSPLGRWLAYTINRGGRSDLVVRDLQRGKDVNAELPLGVVRELAFAPDDGALAFTFLGPRHNSDVWVWDLADDKRRLLPPEKWKRPRQLTLSGRAGIPFSRLVEPKLVEYPTWDRRMIPAWYFEPAVKTVGPPPVIVYPHGGPEGQTRPDFDPILHYFTQHGYAVFAPNVRGSTGYGTAYMNLDNVTNRERAVEDLAHGTRWLIRAKKGDPKRLAIFGWSYGGYMVLASLTLYPDLWAAGIDVVGICDFVTFLEKTSGYRRAHREAEYGSPARDREFLQRISPLNRVKQIRCPLMVIHGETDPRVPFEQAKKIVQALQDRKMPVEALFYKDEGHSLDRLTNQLDAYPKMVRFLDQYVKNKGN